MYNAIWINAIEVDDLTQKRNNWGKTLKQFDKTNVKTTV